MQCVVTSPPYWGLRKYAGEQEILWGGDAACVHEWESRRYYTEKTAAAQTSEAFSVAGRANADRLKQGRWREDNTCVRCGAWRGGYGLEPTIEMYVDHTVQILREIRRVLRKDGVCFWNIGDSYAGSRSGPSRYYPAQESDAEMKVAKAKSRDVKRWGGGGGYDPSLKPKDLCLIPSRVALAAQADGWWVRSMIIWAKPNPMPESVTDRPTDAYEHILMLTRSERYFWDAEAVREKASESSLKRISQETFHQQTGGPKDYAKTGVNPNRSARKALENFADNGGVRNLRNIWTFPTQPYSGAHFATFPEEIPRRCILAASKPGDVILDPFGGSGTTGRVAIELRRRAILCDLAYGRSTAEDIEKAREYHRLAHRRTTEVQINLPL